MVYGFMQAMDAEKDPRNLVIAFRCARLIAQQFPVGEGFPWILFLYCDHLYQDIHWFNLTCSNSSVHILERLLVYGHVGTSQC